MSNYIIRALKCCGAMSESAHSGGRPRVRMWRLNALNHRTLSGGRPRLGMWSQIASDHRKLSLGSLWPDEFPVSVVFPPIVKCQ